MALVAGGFLWWQIKKANQEMSMETKTVIRVSKPKEEQKTEEIDTSNWKTYVNEEYEVKGPTEWKSMELLEQNYFGLGKTIDSSLIEFNVLDNSSEYTPREWLEDRNIDFTTLEETTIDGLPALKVSERLRMGDIPVTIYVTKDKKLYSISCVSALPADLAIFNKVVSSFKLK